MGFKSFAEVWKIEDEVWSMLFWKKKKKNQNKSKGFIINIQSKQYEIPRKNHLNCHKVFLEKAHNTLESEPHV